MKRKLKLVTALKRIAEVRVLDDEWDKEARRAARKARKNGNKKQRDLELRLRHVPAPPKVREPESPLFDGVQVKFGELDQLLRP